MDEEGVNRALLPVTGRHQLYEDVLAIVLGSALVSLGLTFYTEGLLVTGSLAGVALITHYLTGWGFGPVFFLINLPFYALAFWRMGWRFGLKTVVSVLLVSLMTAVMPAWLDILHIAPLYAALMGGGLVGLGMLVLFRHRTSVGGVNVLALYVQERHNIRAGYFQLAVDAVVLLVAFFVLPWERAALSMLGVGVLNLIIAINHKSGRYMGFS